MNLQKSSNYVNIIIYVVCCNNTLSLSNLMAISFLPGSHHPAWGSGDPWLHHCLQCGPDEGRGRASCHGYQHNWREDEAHSEGYPKTRYIKPLWAPHTHFLFLLLLLLPFFVMSSPVSLVDSSDLHLSRSACASIGEVARCGPLPLPSELAEGGLSKLVVVQTLTKRLRKAKDVVVSDP